LFGARCNRVNSKLKRSLNYVLLISTRWTKKLSGSSSGTSVSRGMLRRFPRNVAPYKAAFTAKRKTPSPM